MEIAKNDVYTILKKNNEITDAKFSRIREMIYGFTEDSDFYEVYSNIDAKNKISILTADLKISSILDKYFSRSQDIYSVLVATSYFTYGTDSSSNSEHSKNYIPQNAFMQSQLSEVAQEGQGKMQWIPTYDFAKMFDVDYLKNAEFDYRYLFSIVGQISGSYYNGTYTYFRNGYEKPVLIVNFKEDLFSSVFEGSTVIPESYYFVVDDQRNIISHQDKSLLSNVVNIPELDELFKRKSGIELMMIDGEQRLVSFDRSNITGWLSVMIIPPEELLNPIFEKYIKNMVYTASMITLLFVGFSYYLSGMITQPIRTIIRAIVNTGEGKFNMKFKEKGSFEFKVLMKKFNEMNDNIQRLIKDNYEITIREKEAEIKALNLQLDPHFMYNTLNLISLMSIEKGEDEISEIILSLSTMMKYMVKQDDKLVTFSEDFLYLKSYITIMSNRFDDLFTVEYDIDPDMLTGLVPKFFLQPIVENALIHGFDKMERRGFIKISCRLDQFERIFVVEDNGKGMDQDRVNSITNSEAGSIGLQNVNRRIEITYGEQYGIFIESEPDKGTVVTVKLPIHPNTEKGRF